MKDLDQLKESNPFKTPEGYFDNLTMQIMHQLPERVFEEPKRISLKERVLPWVYLAAVIAGLGLFFDVLNKGRKAGVNFVHNNISDTSVLSPEQEESADYLEYLEAQYASYMLAEKIEELE